MTDKKAEKPIKNDNLLFQQAMQNVQPLKQRKRHHFYKKNKKPPIKEDINETIITLIDNQHSLAVNTEEALFFAKPGIARSLIRKLKKGLLPSEASVDLHGLSVDQAREVMQQFLSDAIIYKYTYIHIIHGKGKLAPELKPKLKNMVNDWLRQCPFVLAFCSTLPKDGGSGAVYVLLKSKIK